MPVDQTACLQKIIEDAERGSHVARLPAGCHYVSKPLWVRAKSPGFKVTGDAGCTIWTDAEMPILQVVCEESGWPELAPYQPTVPSILPGGAKSMKLTSGVGLGPNFKALYFYELRDSSAMELDGLGCFTCEMFFRIDVAPPIFSLVGFGNFLPESLNPAGYPTLDTCTLSLAGNSDRSLSYFLRVRPEQDGPLKQLEGSTNIGAFQLGKVHHLSLTFDGTTATLYIDGIQKHSSTNPGKWVIHQNSQEHCTLGMRTQRWPGNNSLWDMPVGALDILHFSSSVRSADVAEKDKSKVSADKDTLLLMKFDEYCGLCVKAYRPGKIVWLPLRRNAATDAEFPLSVTIDNLTLNGPGCGVFAYATKFLTISNVMVIGARHGIILNKLGYQTVTRSVKIVGHKSRGGFWQTAGSTDVRDLVIDCSITDADYPVIFSQD